MKKILKGIGLVLSGMLIILLILAGVTGIQGYQQYQQVIQQEPIEQKVSQIQEDENYTEIEEISEHFKQALIAVEDHRFYTHSGFDVLTTTRVMFENLFHMSLDAGGSTITQQLARNFYFTQDKLFTRKVAELFVAFDIEEQYSKDDILKLYMNIIYFGNNCYGIKEAAEFYYNKQPSELTLEESTYLAGLPQAPSVYSQDDVKGQQRQKQVTDAMVKYHYLTQEEADEITG